MYSLWYNAPTMLPAGNLNEVEDELVAVNTESRSVLQPVVNSLDLKACRKGPREKSSQRPFQFKVIPSGKEMFFL